MKEIKRILSVLCVIALLMSNVGGLAESTGARFGIAVTGKAEATDYRAAFDGIGDVMTLEEILSDNRVALSANYKDASVSGSGVRLEQLSGKGIQNNRIKNYRLTAIDYFDEAVLTLTPSNAKKAKTIQITLSNPKPDNLLACDAGRLTVLSGELPEGAVLSIAESAPEAGLALDFVEAAEARFGYEDEIHYIYFDVAVAGASGEVHDLGAQVEYDVALPDDMAGLVVLHAAADGVEALDAAYINGTLSFETGSLSQFAAAYTTGAARDEAVIWANDDVYLTGKMPGNAVVVATPVMVEVDGKDVLAAYDIKIYANENQRRKGKTWKPADKKVSVHFYSDRFARATDLAVYTADAAGDDAAFAGAAEPDAGWVAFDAGDANVYAIAGVIEKDVTIDGATYTVTLAYDSTAGIPEGAELEIVENAQVPEGMDVNEAFGWSEDDIVFYTRFMDISIVKDGMEIEPREGSTVEVTVKLKDVEAGAVIDVVHVVDRPNTSASVNGIRKAPARANASLSTVAMDATANPDGSVTFETDSFSLFGFGSVAQPLVSWDTDMLSHTVLGKSRFQRASYAEAEVDDIERGMELLEAYNVTTSDDMWLSLKRLQEVDLGKLESIDLYAVDGSALGALVMEQMSTSDSLRLSTGELDGFALVLDSGLRERRLSDAAEDVAVDGLVPKAAELAVEPVETDLALAAGDVAIASYDITIVNDGEAWQPEEAVQVQWTCPEAAQALEQGYGVEVWHVKDDGARERVDYTLDGETLNFEAESFSEYTVVRVVLERTIEASDGNTYMITASFDSTAGIPADADLQVRELEGEEYQDYLARTASFLDCEPEQLTFARFMDISIVKDGVTYEPDGEVEVTIRLMDKPESDGETSVVHFGDETELMSFAVAPDGTLMFTTDSFSIYAITDGTSDNARIGYRFWYNDGTENILLSTQYFRYKDVHPTEGNALTISEPSVPNMDETTWQRIFKGWSKTSFTDEDSNLVKTNNLNEELAAKAESDFVEGTFTDLFANLQNVYYVTYVDVNPNNVLATEIVPKAETGDTTFSVKPEAQLRPTIDSDTQLEGWYDIDHPETFYTPGQENVVLESSLTLYPKIAGGHWLIFDDNDPVWDVEKEKYVSGGASFTPPSFYLNEVTKRPPDPTWTGYEFGGWYTDKECTTPFEFGSTLEHDTTVYAKWIPSATSYRVVYWKQRTTDAVDAADADKTYDYAGSRLVDTGVVTGQTVNLETADTRVYGANGTSGEDDQQYFVYNANKTDQQVVVKADGSTVLNVYYDRQVITINFSGNLYHYEETTDTTGELYAYVDGEFVRVYPDGNGGYETQETVTRTETVTRQYSGTRYNTTNASYNSNNNQYGVEGGSVVKLNWHDGLMRDYWWTTYENYNYRYTGTRYVINNNGAYGFVNGAMIELNNDGSYTTEETITETVSTPVTGTVYKRVTQNGLTLRGLYGRSMAPGEWPTRNDGYYWGFTNNNSGTTSLNAPWTSYVISTAARSSEINARRWELYQGGSPSVYQKIYYYGEDTNGDYTILLADTGRASNSTLTVNNNKFYGYKMYGWRFGTNGTWHDLTNKTEESIPRPDYTGGGGTTPLYIYYSRDKFDLTFYTNNGSNQVDVIKDVPYEMPLSAYANHSEGQRTGYYFLGWYADPSCSEPFDFTETMPHNNVAVYGKWKMRRVRVVIEPGADNVYMGSQSTTFRLNYDERMDGGLLETAQRAGYILDGWYTDPEFTNRFLFTNPVNDDTTDLEWDYQEDRWKATRVAYGDDDEEHENVRGILHLYAKWILDTTSTGINVIYDPGDAAIYDSLGNLLTTVPIDTRMYGMDGTAIAREAPSGYNDLYKFKYWEAMKSNGETVQYHAGEQIPLAELEPMDIVYDDNGDELRHSVKLRAVYDLVGDPARQTFIVFDGNTFNDTLYNGTQQVLQGKARDGTDRVTIRLDKEVNETIELPGTEDFYLPGWKLVGWSFTKGTYEQQVAGVEINAPNFEPNDKVAADNLKISDLNDTGNTLYAMWQPKTYNVTVRQVVESGVPVNNFEYLYKTGVENAIASATETAQSLTGNSSFKVEDLQYYDRKGHVIHIETPEIPESADYSVRVNAIVTKDDGTREILNPTVAGDYQILGDVEITYTYSMKVLVTLKKRDASNHATSLNGAQFVLTPVEFNSSTQRWQNAGDGQTITVNGDFEKRLQEGTYKITETAAPDNYAKLSTDLYLTVVKDADQRFRLFDAAGHEINAQVAELDETTGRVLTVYDRPIRTVTLSKAVSGLGVSEGFNFTVTAYESDDSRLRNYTIGTRNGSDLVTSSVGTLTLNLNHGDSVELKIPDGCKLTVQETANNLFDTEYLWNSEAKVESNVFGSTPVSITANGTLAFTNTRKTAELTVRKNVTGGMGDRTMKFGFNLSGLQPVEDSAYSYKEADEDKTLAADATGFEFAIKHDETMTITLPIGVAYTIAETPEYGYTTTWKQGEGEAQEGVTAAITLMENATIEFTNDRPAVSPTDVRLNLAPFALMLAAGLMLLLIARRRRQGAKD